MQCPSCAGKVRECGICGGGGWIIIKGCPKQAVTADTWRAFTAADRAERGVWPVAGGWLDQAHSCVQAVDAAQAEDALWKNWKRK